jgi:hypothetical protein
MTLNAYLSHAIENPRAAGTAQFGHKTSIDILSGAVRQLPDLFRMVLSFSIVINAITSMP